MPYTGQYNSRRARRGKGYRRIKEASLGVASPWLPFSYAKSKWPSCKESLCGFRATHSIATDALVSESIGLGLCLGALVAYCIIMEKEQGRGRGGGVPWKGKRGKKVVNSTPFALSPSHPPLLLSPYPFPPSLSLSIPLSLPQAPNSSSQLHFLPNPTPPLFSHSLTSKSVVHISEDAP